MNTVKYDSDITALLVIDPYNDFISEGGNSPSSQVRASRRTESTEA
jgi:hypothetical protein